MKRIDLSGIGQRMVNLQSTNTCVAVVWIDPPDICEKVKFLLKSRYGCGSYGIMLLLLNTIF
jgi:hypothetical protein